MIYGYARCSTCEDKQDIDRQIRELKAAGADEVVFEYEHGDAKLKKNLSMLLDTVQEGDISVRHGTAWQGNQRMYQMNLTSLAAKSLMIF